MTCEEICFICVCSDVDMCVCVCVCVCICICHCVCIYVYICKCMCECVAFKQKKKRKENNIPLFGFLTLFFSDFGFSHRALEGHFYCLFIIIINKREKDRERAGETLLLLLGWVSLLITVFFAL